MFWASGFWVDGFWSEGFWEGLASSVGGKRNRRKRVIVAGKTYFLNPQELAELLTAQYRTQLEAEAQKPPEIAAVVDCARIKAIADVKASGEFIARMNAEFLRLEQEAIQQQQLEEDDEECLMLLAA